MDFKKVIISSIQKYGSSCQIDLSSDSQLNFKAIISFPSDNALARSQNLFNLDPSSPPSASLIVADPRVLDYITPDIIIKTANNNFQITKIKKFFLSDKLYYISASLLTI